MVKKVTGPVCPNCGKQPHDIIRLEPQNKGPAIKRTVWFCPSIDCNPWGKIMSDEEVWPR